MHIRRIEDDWGIEVRISVEAGDLFSHRIHAAPYNFDENDKRIAPVVQISLLSCGRYTPDDVRAYALEIIAVAHEADKLQAEINERFAAEQAAKASA